MTEPEFDSEYLQTVSVPDHCLYLRFVNDDDCAWFANWLLARGWDLFVDDHERATRGDRW
jgi:hypothetical protein